MRRFIAVTDVGEVVNLGKNEPQEASLHSMVNAEWVVLRVSSLGVFEYNYDLKWTEVEPEEGAR